MTTPPTRSVRVESDLAIELDGVSAHLHAHGDHLVLSTAQPHRLWQLARQTSLPDVMGSVATPRSIGKLADSLADAGLLLEITGPHGSVASLGRGVDSRLGRLGTGSAAVRPGGLSAVVAATGQRPGRRASLLLAGCSILMAAFVTRWRRRSRRGTAGRPTRGT